MGINDSPSAVLLRRPVSPSQKVAQRKREDNAPELDIWGWPTFLPLLLDYFRLVFLRFIHSFNVLRQGLLEKPRIVSGTLLNIGTVRHHQVVNFIALELCNYPTEGNLSFEAEDRLVLEWLIIFEPSMNCL